MEIDFIITWVDGNDEKWLNNKNTALDKANIRSKNEDWATGEARYCDWNNLQYWFRAVEKFCPWVHKIHFVTYGHLPSWLNLNHPKLNIVQHDNYIPNEYLPTFNSNTIELNFHRISELSEQFVIFNDDTFIIRPMQPKDFFNDGKPCYTAILNASTPIKGAAIADINNVAILNTHFVKNDVIKSNIGQWFNLKYGLELFRTCLLMPWRHFTGFKQTHLPVSHQKSTFETVWNLEYEALDEACKHVFRTDYDLSHWLLMEWNIASGDFYPQSPKRGYKSNLGVTKKAIQIIQGQRRKMICINDMPWILDKEFQVQKEILINTLDTILPEKSSYEM